MDLPFKVITGLEDATSNFEAIQGRDILNMSAPFVDITDSRFYYGNGSDLTKPLQAAISSLPQTGNTETSGGTILLPPNRSYTFTSTLNCDELVNVRLWSPGGRRGGAVLYASFAGGSSATMISARSSDGFELAGGIALVNQDASYAGIAVDLSTIDALVNTKNTAHARLVGGRIDLAASNTVTAYGVKLRNAQTCSISRMIFTGGYDAIRGTDSTSDFSNSITISDRCLFQNQRSTPIHNPCQAWTISDAVFEPLFSGHAGAVYVDSSAAPLQGLCYTGNSHQDADDVSSGGTLGRWLTLRGGGAYIAGNFFSTGYEDLLLANTGGGAVFDGLTAIGNHVYDVGNGAWDLGASNPTHVFIGGNHYGPGTVTTKVIGTAGANSSVLD